MVGRVLYNGSFALRVGTLTGRQLSRKAFLFLQLLSCQGFLMKLVHNVLNADLRESNSVN